MAESSQSRSKLRRMLAHLAARLATEEGGATAIEYALMASGIGAAIAATVFGFGSDLKSTLYDKVATALK
jgi:Flp pilus assembly pilin Flp